MIKNGMRFYDERNDRYLTTNGQGVDPRCWCCIEEIYDEEQEDYVISDTVLMMKGELKKFAMV